MSRSNILNNLTEELRNNSTATIMFHQAIGTKLGLNPTDHKCLDVILRNQPLTAGRLSDLTGLTTGAITGVLDRLEKAGYVYRMKDPQDQRRVIIHIDQEKAEKDISPLFHLFGKEMSQMLSSYDDEDLQKILDFIKQCNGLLRDFTEQMIK
ncbi:putative HTH-type transcriptional regulator YcgE [Paenibacillus sp. J31TS4]|uniref:MarR family transcriptional regulator n=1 Tax=Paenibacillus sp. J31TS4 TaxID=2807195 RepID=UPI001B20BA6E|nr:MarR family transcriptional regulator [Paenibacillus sp. J31TS4]GIP40685.1 putative HTH-type transcriptional regulator YcgE [Paenibacillus sp. J31TS4]